MEKVFLDTNVFVYAEDVSAGAGMISTQVLQEFFVVARRKIELFAGFEVVGVTVPLLLGAVDLHRLRGLSLWDALVVRAAALAGCRTLLSEDLNAGQVIEGVRVVNPFG